jgi:hypothetical protein
VLVLVQADLTEARRERDAVQVALRAMLRRRTGERADSLLGPDGLDLSHPAAFSVAFAMPGAQDDTRAADDAVHALEPVVAAGRRRAARSGCPSWPVDLAPPEPHLVRSVARAVEQAPRLPDREPPNVHVVDWRDSDRAGMCAAACLIATVFPEVFAELSLVVRQVALIEGSGIAGFTDFGVMGAIVVNRRRFGDASNGLPGPIRFAESLVHEGAHARCNAAGWSGPYLADPGARTLTVHTPLRPDPRPLNGLFQQLIVLMRSAELYDRILDPAGSGPREVDAEQRRAIAARRDTLRAQAAQAADTMDEHRTGLSERGRAELDAAVRLLDRRAAPEQVGPGLP